MADGIYVSLDEAREELKKRWADVELRKRIEEELGDKFLPPFKDMPRAVLNRQVASPDNGFVFLYQCAKYVGAEPLAWEESEDIFVSFNEEKKGLGRLRVTLENGEKATVDVMDFHTNEKKKLNECVLKNGEKLVDFHHNLCKISGYEMEIYDNPEWRKKVQDVSGYYYYTMLHLIAHGILFETFSFDDREKGEAGFVEKIVLPNIERVEKEFGLRPLIVRLYPEDQTDDEDFYWWSYPPGVNKHIIDCANNFNLKIKLIK
ncbi:MAG: hypothetical protein WC120_02455 [Parcubacteria group bacterium]